MPHRHPLCTHSREVIGRVSSHTDMYSAWERGVPHASIETCGRNECIADAQAWVAEVSGRSGTFYHFYRGW